MVVGLRATAPCTPSACPFLPSLSAGLFLSKPQIKASKLPLCTTSTKLLSRTSGRAVYAARIKTWQVSLNQVQVKPSGLLLKLHQVHRLIVEDAAARMLSKSCRCRNQMFIKSGTVPAPQSNNVTCSYSSFVVSVASISG